MTEKVWFWRIAAIILEIFTELSMLSFGVKSEMLWGRE